MSQTGTTIAVTMPQLGETVTEGTITQWHKQPGDRVEKGEALFEMSTDKVDTEIPAAVAGRLVEIKVAVDQTVPVGVTLALIDVGGDDGGGDDVDGDNAQAVVSEPERPHRDAGPRPGGSPRHDAVPRHTATPPHTASPRHNASPRMRRRLLELGIDEASLTGSGPHGRVTMADLSSAAPTPEAVDAPASAPTRAPVVAASGSFAFISMLVDFRAVRAICASVTADWMLREGFELDHVPFVCRAVAEAIDRSPGIDGGSVGAVTLDLDGHVFTDARDMRVAAFARGRHRAARADSHDPATVTIKHTGASGSHLSRPAMHPGTPVVLTLDAVIATPMAVGTGEGQAIGIRPVANVGLSYDTGVIDDVIAAQFLAQVKRAIERADWPGEV